MQNAATRYHKDIAALDKNTSQRGFPLEQACWMSAAPAVIWGYF